MSTNTPIQQDMFSYDFGNITMSSGITGIANTGPSTSIYTITDSTGSGGYQYNWTTGTDTITLANWPGTEALDVKGTANFEDDIKIKGKSLLESLEKIEERLAILRPNPELEERWDELRELRKKYMELEKEIIEKEKVWNILKK